MAPLDWYFVIPTLNLISILLDPSRLSRTLLLASQFAHRCAHKIETPQTLEAPETPKALEH